MSENESIHLKNETMEFENKNLYSKICIVFVLEKFNREFSSHFQWLFNEVNHNPAKNMISRINSSSASKQ